MKLFSALAGLLAIVMLAACDTGATPTAVTISPTQAGGQPTSPAGNATPTRRVTGLVTRAANQGPVFAFMPPRGGPDSIINITGGNFTPGQTVVIRIGIPDPIGEPLASVTTGEDGRWNTSFKIPGTEPSGKPITATEIRILAMDENNKVLASKPFKFLPKP